MSRKRIASVVLVVIGGLCWLAAVALIWQRQNPGRLALDTREFVPQSHSATTDRLPQTLMIAALDMHLPIYPAKIEEGKWETTPDGVSYLVGSALPGTPGNSVLYGHNWVSLLGALPEAQPGQEILIQWADGEIRRFVITEAAVVTPDQTHILAPTSDTRLTIYTCTGFLDRKRFVVTAVPV